MAKRKVRFVQKITGTRDGVEWPDVGDVVSLEAAEADELEAQGFVVKVAAEKKVEAAAEDRTVEKKALTTANVPTAGKAPK